MYPVPTDSGVLSDLFHLGKRGSQEARKRGENDSGFKMMMGVALIAIGSTMMLENFEKMHGGRGR